MSQSSNLSNCQIEHHFEFLMDSFQEMFLQFLTQKKEVVFDEILYKTLGNAGIETYKKDNLNLFLNWFENVYNQKYLDNPILDNDVNEIILSSDGNLQTLGPTKKNINIELKKHIIDISFEVLAIKNNSSWNYSQPFCSFYTTIQNIPVRVTLIHFSCSAIGVSKIFIRKHNTIPLPLDSFGIQSQSQPFFCELIAKKKNVLVTGSTGSGKTSLLKSLITYIPKDEHLICIEDTYEIYPQSHNHTSLLAADLPKKSLKDYCAYAMRMSPERIILGEIRSHEIVPFLLSLNTGHKGVMASTHANCAREGVERLALLYSMYAATGDVKYSTILELLCKNIDFIIHMENKEICEVIELYGADNENILYETHFKKEKVNHVS